MKLNRVLIVDDSASSRAFLSGLLVEQFRLKPTQIHQAASGEEAIKLLTHERFDVIFLDLYMPNTTGFEILNAMRFSGNRTPVIMVSSEDHEYVYEQAKRAGADEYLTKPIDPEVLKPLLTRLLALR